MISIPKSNISRAIFMFRRISLLAPRLGQPHAYQIAILADPGGERECRFGHVHLSHGPIVKGQLACEGVDHADMRTKQGRWCNLPISAFSEIGVPICLVLAGTLEV